MNIQLSISLLASDRPDTLKKCLDSLTPFLKTLNSELIIVFTGKEPDTLGLIRQYTSHIIPFDWCDDFSAARNAGLKEASGEWFLFIDDDEWFEDPDEIIQFFKTGEYRQYRSAYYVVRNYTDWDGKKYTDAHISRMCRLTAETLFVKPIHEYLQPFFEPHKYFKCFVHHYGYIREENAKNSYSKFERNLPILLKQYEKYPDVQNCMQLVQEYQGIDDFTSAVKYCRQGLELAKKEQRIGACELWMQVRLPLILSSAGKPKEALNEGERLLRSPRTLEVGQAHLHAILSELCWEISEFQKGIKHVIKYHEKMRYLKKHPDIAERQNGATVTYESAKERGMTTYVAGLLFAAELKNVYQIKEILTWIPWDDEVQAASQYMNLEKWKSGHPELLESILEGFSTLKTANSYVTLQKALYAEKKQLLEETEKYFMACTSDCPGGFLYQLVELAARNGFSLHPLLSQISTEAWDECTRILAERISILDMRVFTEKIRTGMRDYPIYTARLEQRFQEKELLHGNLKMPRLAEVLQQYWNSVFIEAKALYKEELLSNPDHYALPSRYKFAFAIRSVLEHMEKEKYEDCIPFLEKAVHSWPEMSNVVGRLSRVLEGKLQEPEKPVSEEFEVLGRQVKQVLYGLMETGQWEEALSVVNQLAMLLPDDLEVIKLKQEILQKQ